MRSIAQRVIAVLFGKESHLADCDPWATRTPAKAHLRPKPLTVSPMRKSMPYLWITARYASLQLSVRRMAPPQDFDVSANKATMVSGPASSLTIAGRPSHLNAAECG